eukprot:TRINITY_DN1339_c0_g2_i1.p1 TRINITY_DN1339_c0_g2~~TRINITY_DN1339_c0_g2_i1.p1  ORF type:complete len:851 (+),score=161.70 TRINITY_DN1339_c0_g2_i1:301-2853(+)
MMPMDEDSDVYAPQTPPRKIKSNPGSGSMQTLPSINIVESPKEEQQTPIRSQFSASLPSFGSAAMAFASSFASAISMATSPSASPTHHLSPREREPEPERSYSPEFEALESTWEAHEDEESVDTATVFNIAQDLCELSHKENHGFKTRKHHQRSESLSMTKEETLLVKIEKKLRVITMQYDNKHQATLKHEIELIRAELLYLRSECHYREIRTFNQPLSYLAPISKSASPSRIVALVDVQGKTQLRVHLLLISGNLLCDILEVAFDQRAIQLLSKVIKRLAVINPIQEPQFELFDRMFRLALKFKELGSDFEFTADLGVKLMLTLAKVYYSETTATPPRSGLKEFPLILEKLDLKPELRSRIESLMYAIPTRERSNSSLLLSEMLKVNGSTASITLTPMALTYIFTKHTHKETIKIEDILSIEKKPSHLTLHTFPVMSYHGRQPKRRYQMVKLEATSQSSIENLEDQLREIMYGPNFRTKASRKLLVLVNPFSGTRQARKVFDSRVKYVLDLANNELEYLMVETQYAGHASDIIKTSKDLPLHMNIESLDGVVCISGDGLLFEVINGFMSRSDWKTLSHKLTFGAIAGGSANGLCTATGTLDPVTAAFYVARGDKRPLDLYSIAQEGEPVRWGFLQHSWAMLSDLDFESEKYRWMGEMRFTVQAVKRVAKVRKYEGRLCYLPAAPDQSFFTLCTYHNCNTCKQHVIDCYEKPKPTDSTTPNTIDHQFGNEPSGWVVEEGRFILVCLSNVPDIGANTMISPYAHIGDGCMDLVIVKDDAGRHDLTNILLKLETGEHIHHPKVHYAKVKAYTLEPKRLKNKYGMIGSDGEQLPHKPVKVVVHPALVSLFGRP